METKILIVDDNVDFTELLKASLESTGKYRVQAENHGSRGLTVAKAFKPDLILLDVMMPDMDGSDVAEEMRGEEDIKNIPIAFLTSIVEEEEVESHNGVIGGNRFIAKTVPVREIINSIEKVLRKCLTDSVQS